MLGEDFLCPARGRLSYVDTARGLPHINDSAIGNFGIEKIRLHAGESISFTKKMTGVIDHRADCRGRQGLGTDLNRVGRPQNTAKHVIINDHGLKGYSHQTGLGTTCLGDDVGTGLNAQANCQTFFITTLRIRQLALGCAGNGRGWQAVMPRHLHCCCGQ